MTKRCEQMWISKFQQIWMPQKAQGLYKHSSHRTGLFGILCTSCYKWVNVGSARDWHLLVDSAVVQNAFRWTQPFAIQWSIRFAFSKRNHLCSTELKVQDILGENTLANVLLVCTVHGMIPTMCKFNRIGAILRQYLCKHICQIHATVIKLT